jgi:hypothetical protein
MLVPLYGFLKGDTLGLLILVHDRQRVREIVAVLQQAAAPRVAPFPNAVVYWKGMRVDPDTTIAKAGIEPLDRVDVVPELENGL